MVCGYEFGLRVCSCCDNCAPVDSGLRNQFAAMEKPPADSPFASADSVSPSITHLPTLGHGLPTCSKVYCSSCRAASLPPVTNNIVYGSKIIAELLAAKIPSDGFPLSSV